MPLDFAQPTRCRRRITKNKIIAASLLAGSGTTSATTYTEATTSSPLTGSKKSSSRKRKLFESKTKSIDSESMNDSETIVETSSSFADSQSSFLDDSFDVTEEPNEDDTINIHDAAIHILQINNIPKNDDDQDDNANDDESKNTSTSSSSKAIFRELREDDEENNDNNSYGSNFYNGINDGSQKSGLGMGSSKPHVSFSSTTNALAAVFAANASLGTSLESSIYSSHDQEQPNRPPFRLTRRGTPLGKKKKISNTNLYSKQDGLMKSMKGSNNYIGKENNGVSAGNSSFNVVGPPKVTRSTNASSPVAVSLFGRSAKVRKRSAEEEINELSIPLEFQEDYRMFAEDDLDDEDDTKDGSDDDEDDFFPRSHDRNKLHATNTISHWNSLMANVDKTDPTSIVATYWKYCYGDDNETNQASSLLQMNAPSQSINRPPLPTNHSVRQTSQSTRSIMKNLNNQSASGGAGPSQTLMTPQRFPENPNSSLRLKAISSDGVARSVGSNNTAVVQFTASSAAEFDKDQPVHRSLTPLPPKVAAERFPTTLPEADEEEPDSDETRFNSAILAKWDEIEDDDDEQDENSSDDVQNVMPESPLRKPTSHERRRRGRRSSSKGNEKRDGRRSSFYFSSNGTSSHDESFEMLADSLNDNTRTTSHYSLVDTVNRDSIEQTKDQDISLDMDAEVMRPQSALEKLPQSLQESDQEKLSPRLTTAMSPQQHIDSTPEVPRHQQNLPSDENTTSQFDVPLQSSFVFTHCTSVSPLEESTQNYCLKSPLSINTIPQDTEPVDEWDIFDKFVVDPFSESITQSESSDKLNDMLSTLADSSILAKVFGQAVGILKSRALVLQPCQTSMSPVPTETEYTDDEAKAILENDFNLIAAYDLERITISMLDAISLNIQAETMGDLDRVIMSLNDGMASVSRFDLHNSKHFLVKQVSQEEEFLGRSESELLKKIMQRNQTLTMAVEMKQEETNICKLMYRTLSKMFPLKLNDGISFESCSLNSKCVVDGSTISVDCNFMGEISNICPYDDDSLVSATFSPIPRTHLAALCYSRLLQAGLNAHFSFQDETDVDYPEILTFATYLDRLHDAVIDLKQVADMCEVETAISKQGFVLTIHLSSSVDVRVSYNILRDKQRLFSGLPSTVEVWKDGERVENFEHHDIIQQMLRTSVPSLSTIRILEKICHYLNIDNSLSA